MDRQHGRNGSVIIVPNGALTLGTTPQYHCPSNRKRRQTLAAIVTDPVPATIAWTDIESLLKACGAHVREGSGSRVRVTLNEVRATFHRPHPQKETDRGAVRSVRMFLSEAKVTP